MTTSLRGRRIYDVAIVAGVTAAAIAGALVAAQQPPADPLINESVIAKLSDHVHVIPDLNVGLVPNVGITSAPAPRWWWTQAWAREMEQP